MIRFEWDGAKAKSNELKHRVTFEEAIAVFDDFYALFRKDHSAGHEDRWQAIGSVSGMAILLVVHTVRESAGNESEIVRIISARAATKRERALYDKNCAQDFG